MTNTPIVSVIIPNYNHARYLDQRIQTVLGQTYQNFEVIILDDCSTDNSLEVIAKYKDNPHVSQVVVNKQNSGSTFKQWDKGIHLAKGDVIWIAESDDYCELNMLEELVKAMINNPKVVIAACNSEWVNESGKSLWRYCSLENSIEIFDGKDFIIKRMSYDDDIPNASAVVFSKQSALKISRDYVTYKAAGDRLFWILMCETGNVIRVNQYLNHFRQHNNKVSPMSELNGTVFFEDRQIINYIIHSGVLKGLAKQRSILHFQTRAFQKKYESEKIRRKVYKTWNCDGFLGMLVYKIRRKIIKIIDKFVSK